MIVQTALDDGPSKVVTMRDHLGLVAQLGRAFGNEEFASLNPRDLMDYAIAHHDAGWDEVDADLGIDPATGMPRNLLQTPLDRLAQTGPASAAFNEAHHPFCGLLISMHAYGLLNGRYGLSDKIVVDVLPADAQPMFREVCEAELRRQDRLKSTLAADPRTAEWVAEDTLFHNYKLLQFFDTLGLYFCMEHPESRYESRFLNVPVTVGTDVTVTVTPQGAGVYRVSPFPFATDPLVVNLDGVAVSPDPTFPSAAAALAAGVADVETITLVS